MIRFNSNGYQYEYKHRNYSGCNQADVAEKNAFKNNNIKEHDGALDDFLQNIVTPGSWDNLAADIIPQLITQLPSWPQNRALIIDVEKYQHCYPESLTEAREALQLRLHLNHYTLLDDGKEIAIARDGDCFYRAILMGLTSEERFQLLEQQDLHPESPEAVGLLRNIMAQHVLKNAHMILPLISTSFVSSSADDMHNVSISPMPDNDDGGILSFISEARLREAQEFRRKGHNRQIPGMDPMLVTQLRQTLAEAESYLALQASVSAPPDCEWLVNHINQIKWFSCRFLDGSAQDWVNQQVAIIKGPGSGDDTLGSRKAAQSLVRRLESTLRIFIRIIQVLFSIDNYSTPEKRHKMLVTELIDTLPDPDAYNEETVTGAVEKIIADPAAKADWSYLMEARKASWVLTVLDPVIKAISDETKKANIKAYQLSGGPRIFFIKLADYLQQLFCELTEISLNSNIQAPSGALDKVDGKKVTTSLSRSTSLKQGIVKFFDKRYLQLQVGATIGTGYIYKIARLLKSDRTTTLSSKQMENAIANSVIRSILWQWQQPAIKIQYASSALLIKAKGLRKIDAMLMPDAEICEKESKDDDNMVSIQDEDDTDVLVREWIRSSLEQEKPENQLQEKLVVLERLLQGDIDYARKVVENHGCTTEGIQDELERQWLSVKNIADERLSDDTTNVLWEKVNTMAEHFMPDIARELATAVNALNNALMAAEKSSRNLSVTKTEARKAQLLAVKIKEKISIASSRLAERSLDEYSRGSRLTKHWATLSRAVNRHNLPLPEPAQMLSSLKKVGLTEDILSNGDPEGYLFSTRLATEFKNAHNNELRLPMSPQQYVDLEKKISDYIVSWGQRRTSRGVTRVVIELAFESTLDTVTYSLSNLVRLPYKILKASIKIPYKVNKVNNYTMPGNDKPYKAIYSMLEKKLAQLGFSLLTTPVPGMVKLGIGAGVTVGAALYNLYWERNENCFVAVFQLVAEGEKTKKLKMDSPERMAFDSITDGMFISGFKGVSAGWRTEKVENGIIPNTQHPAEYYRVGGKKALAPGQTDEITSEDDDAAWINPGLSNTDDGPVSQSSSLQQDPNIELLSDNREVASVSSSGRVKRGIPPDAFDPQPRQQPHQVPAAASNPGQSSHHNSGITKVPMKMPLEFTWAGLKASQYAESFARPFSTLSGQVQLISSALAGATIQETEILIDQAKYIGSWIDTTFGVVTSFSPMGCVLNFAQSVANIIHDVLEGREPDPLAVAGLVFGILPGGSAAAKVGKFTRLGGQLIKYAMMIGNKVIDLAMLGNAIKIAAETGDPLAIYQALLASGLSVADSYSMTKNMCSKLKFSKTIEESASLEELEAIHNNSPEYTLSSTMPERTFVLGEVELLGRVNNGQIEVSNDNGVTWVRGNKLHLLAYRLQNAGGGLLSNVFRNKIVIGKYTFKRIKFDENKVDEVSRISKTYASTSAGSERIIKARQDFQNARENYDATEYRIYDDLTFDEQLDLFLDTETKATTRGALSGRINETLKKINLYNAAMQAKEWKSSAIKAHKVILFPQNIFLRGRSGRCLPASIMMGWAIQIGQESQFADKLMGLYESTDMNNEPIYQSLVELHGNNNPSKFKGKALPDVNINTLSDSESNLFGAEGGSVRIDILEHTMLLSKVKRNGKVEYIFYDPNYGMAYFKKYTDMINFFKSRLAKDRGLDTPISFCQLDYSRDPEVEIAGKNIDQIVNSEAQIFYDQHFADEDDNAASGSSVTN